MPDVEVVRFGAVVAALFAALLAVASVQVAARVGSHLRRVLDASDHAVAVEQSGRLLRFQPLSPLTADPDDWFDHGEMSGTPLWQSKRDPSAFSEDGGVTHYFVDDRDGPGERVMHSSAPVA